MYQFLNSGLQTTKRHVTWVSRGLCDKVQVRGMCLFLCLLGYFATAIPTETLLGFLQYHQPKSEILVGLQ
jgi:hypothetical protein